MTITSHPVYKSIERSAFTQVEFEVEYDRSSNTSSPDNVEVVLPTVSQTPEKNESNKRRKEYM